MRSDDERAGLTWRHLYRDLFAARQEVARRLNADVLATETRCCAAEAARARLHDALRGALVCVERARRTAIETHDRELEVMAEQMLRLGRLALSAREEHA